MGSFNVYASGAWRKAKSAHVFASGAWRKSKAVWVFASGAWRKVSLGATAVVNIGNIFNINYGYYAQQNKGSMTPQAVEGIGTVTQFNASGSGDNFNFHTSTGSPACNITIEGFGTFYVGPTSPGTGQLVKVGGISNFMKARVGQNINVSFAV